MAETETIAQGPRKALLQSLQSCYTSELKKITTEHASS